MTLRESTLRERMAADRARLFVGRTAELAALDTLLAPDSASAIAWVYGPGGMGKTELVRAFQRRCEAQGRATAWIDGGSIPANPIAFRAAFDEARAAADVIVVDRTEYLGAIVPWLCATFLPDLPVSMRLVFAGRDRPPAALTGDPAWLRIVRVLELGGFTPDDCADYLRRRDVSVERHAAIARATFRHPLALALLAEVLAQSRGAAPDLAEHPDLVRGLLAQLLREVPSPRHQLALWSLAVVRHLTLPLIRALVDAEADDLYEWLRERTFVRIEPGGLVPHDLVREVLLADLSWTDPIQDRRLAVRAVEVLVDSFDTAGADASHVLGEIYFAAGGRAAILGAGRGEYAAEPLRREEWPAVEEMTARQEGPTSARLLRFWLERGGDAWGIRDLDDRLAGFALFLWVHEIAPADAREDPFVAPIYARLDGPGGPPSTCFMRYWMDGAQYKALGPTQFAANKLSGEVVWRRRPDILIGADRPIELFFEIVPPGMYERWPFDVELDGGIYGVFGVDYRADPLVPWFKRFMRTMMQTAPVAPPVPRDVFDPAVREALRALHRPDGLLASPLLESRLVRATRPETPLQAAHALGDLLREQCRMFLGSDKDAVHYRVLEATYFEPHAKQLQAAGAVGMPYGTYRRTLTVAVRRLIDALWLRETS